MRWIVVLLATAAVLLTVPRSAAAAARTPEELAALAVTPEELGPGFSVVDENSDSMSSPSFLRTLYRESPREALIGVILFSDALLTPDQAVDIGQRIFTEPSTGRQIVPGERLTPGGFPAGAVAVALAGTIGATPFGGSLVAWREADVLATTVVLVEHGADMSTEALAEEVVHYSRIQRDKLAAGVSGGAQSGAPQSPELQVPVGVIDCSSFTHQEAGQALLAAYPGDPYGLDRDGNGRACEDLPFRSDAPPAPAPPPADTPAAPLFEATGTGDGQTDNFQVEGRVQVCWEVSGRSSTGTIGPRASFYFYPQGTSGGSYRSSLTGKEENGCSFVNIPADSYYVEVIATSWTRWRITVHAA